MTDTIEKGRNMRDHVNAALEQTPEVNEKMRQVLSFEHSTNLLLEKHEQRLNNIEKVSMRQDDDIDEALGEVAILKSQIEVLNTSAKNQDGNVFLFAGVSAVAGSVLATVITLLTVL